MNSAEKTEVELRTAHPVGFRSVIWLRYELAALGGLPVAVDLHADPQVAPCPFGLDSSSDGSTAIFTFSDDDDWMFSRPTAMFSFTPSYLRI